MLAAASGGSTEKAAPRQPPGLFLLFVVEMWERFSFYGMKALLVLFIADSARGGLGWSKASAARVLGIYGASAYGLMLAGGYAADRFLGTHRAMVIGALVIAAGHFCLAIPAVPAFFCGLALVALGTGLFKTNASTMVGQLYRQGDTRRDGGFTIFYMGINVGGLLGPLACGYLAESPRWGWHYGFGAAGVGMLAGLAVYLRYKRRYLGDIGERPNRELASVAGAAPEPLSPDERRRLVALLIIIAFSIPFWMAFEQTGSSMNFFAAERTDRVVFGQIVPASWFQSINSAVLLLSAPVFAALWTTLGRRGREPSTPAKMTAAMVLLGAGFAFMVVAAQRSEGGQLASPLFLVAAYSFHTFGELCLSPIGLSLVTKLAPLKFASLLMGVWFFATAISEFLAGQLAALTDKAARGELFRVFGGQADFFLIFVISSAVAALGLVLLAPWLRRAMQGRDT
jgi:proton-dependent oligopeptide transporter, POT family